MKWLLIILIRGYQGFISPFLGPKCRFYPSCSAYCQDALSKLPLTKAITLSLFRFLRCHPFSEGGFDPVPK